MFTAFAANTNSLETALIGLAILVFFIVRQFRTRRIASIFNLLVPIALLYFGAQGLSQLDTVGWLLLGLSLSLAVVFGVARGMTFRVWTGPQGEALMRGTALTLVLWLATIGIKVGLSLLEAHFGFGSVASSSAETMLPGALTIAAQMLVVYLRSQDQRQLAYRVS
jgi:hypothetical protein